MQKVNVKVVLIGEIGVGKSSFAQAIKFGACHVETSNTIGAAFLKVESKGPHDLSIWDTAGAERFKSLMPMYVRNSEVCIAAFDCTRLDTLETAVKWHFEYLDTIENCDKALWILVGCKYDKSDERQLSDANIEDWKQKYGVSHLSHFFVSSKSGEGVKQVKDFIYDYLLQNEGKHYSTNRQEMEKRSDVFKLDDEKPGMLSKCCPK
jgi:small GTP-binding protein